MYAHQLKIGDKITPKNSNKQKEIKSLKRNEKDMRLIDIITTDNKKYQVFQDSIIIN